MVVNESAWLAQPARRRAQKTALPSQGDRAYARGQYGEAGKQSGQPLLGAGLATPVPRLPQRGICLDPANGEVPGYEAQYVGKAELERRNLLNGADAGWRYHHADRPGER